MKQRIYLLGMVSTLLLTAGQVTMADADMKTGTVKNPVYEKECGSCHLAFPAGLLPQRSWEKMMSQLDNHFGDNAEMPADLHKQVLSYLTANAADRVNPKLARSMASGEPLLRITETASFRREHREVKDRMVKGNDQVRSFSNCAACHQRAKEGSYREREIRIPGFGRWED